MIWIRLALIASVLSALAFFVWDYTSTKAENKRLVTELTAANSTILALDTLVEKRNQIRNDERNLIDEIENAPEDHDAVTAPVLLDAIERLRAP